MRWRLEPMLKMEYLAYLCSCYAVDFQQEDDSSPDLLAEVGAFFSAGELFCKPVVEVSDQSIQIAVNSSYVDSYQNP